LEDDNVQRIATSQNRVVQTIPVGDAPSYPNLAGTIWVPNTGDGTVTRLDPETGRVMGRPVKIGQTADRVSVGVGAVWVTSYADQTLTRLEPAR
jgi:virginiamycin B lyase